MILLTFVGGIIFFLAPVEDNNKPLDKKEKTVYKKRARIILSVLIGLTLISWFIGWKQISLSILASLLMLTITLVLGQLTNVFNRFQSTRNVLE